ncbi:conserved hypothetical protein [Paraburkholderia caribensis]|nr:conserved hypothetical protein [Paraburkholderia caribensis]
MRVAPDDFPREPRLGVVAGVQPKLLVRKIDGLYRTGLTADELWARYDACEDLAEQLAKYTSRTRNASGLSLDDTLKRAEKGLKAKVDSGQWDFSVAEIAWVMKRTHELTLAAANGGEDGNVSC